jgi:4-hydroxy-tetrahydrodipicolinate synthase
MHPDGSLDWEALDALLEWHVAAGTAGVVAVGTTGESATLDVDEHVAVIGRCVETLRGRLPVIAGTGSNSTREAIDLSREAARVGADALLLVTPYYNRPSQLGLERHFEAVADAVDLPQILYNVPSRTAVDMQLQTTLRLAQHARIVGIKDATGDLGRGRELLARRPDGFAVYSGDDATAAQLMLAGAAGSISVTANLVPERVAALCAAALAGDRQRTEMIDRELAGLNRVLFVEANPIPVKYALVRAGRIQPGIRLPLTELDAAGVGQVDAVLGELAA